MRALLFIIIILTMISCNQESTPKGMETEELKYSAFNWQFNDMANKRELYLDHYINIKKNGTFVLMKHEELMDHPIYSNGIVDKSILNLIDTFFLNRKYKSDYVIDSERLAIYDGLTYCFDYKKEGAENKEILFIPTYSPTQLKFLGLLLDTLIAKSSETKMTPLNLRTYKERLSKISQPYLPPMPLPPPPINNNEKRFETSQ